MRFEPRAPREDINVSPQHPLHEATLLVAGVVGVVVFLGIVIGVGVDLAIRWIPPEFESRAFGGLRASPAGYRAAMTGDAAVPQRVLARLAAHWPDAPYEFSILVIESETANAAALPGGSVLLTRGLLNTVESENELAFVLGHELGHFHGRDHLRRLGRGAVYGLALAAVLGRAGGGQGLASLTGDLTSRGFDRGQERDADAYGLRLLDAEFGHIGGATAFFEHLSSLEATNLQDVVAYFSTHPSTLERSAEIARLAHSRGYALTGALGPLPGDESTEPE